VICWAFGACRARARAQQTKDRRWLEANRAARIVGPLLAMADAEGTVVSRTHPSPKGLLVGVVLYAAVQPVEGKRELIVAAAFGGLVWGGLFEWRHGVRAPIAAHALWTVALSVVWPLHTHTRQVHTLSDDARSRNR
jgi:hypothetical protein